MGGSAAKPSCHIGSAPWQTVNHSSIRYYSYMTVQQATRTAQYSGQGHSCPKADKGDPTPLLKERRPLKFAMSAAMVKGTSVCKQAKAAEGMRKRHLEGEHKCPIIAACEIDSIRNPAVAGIMGRHKLMTMEGHVPPGQQQPCCLKWSYHEHSTDAVLDVDAFTLTPALPVFCLQCNHTQTVLLEPHKVFAHISGFELTVCSQRLE